MAARAAATSDVSWLSVTARLAARRAHVGDLAPRRRRFGKAGDDRVGILKGCFGIAEVAPRCQAPGIGNRGAGLGELAGRRTGRRRRRRRPGGGLDRRWRCGGRGGRYRSSLRRLRRRLWLVALIDIEPASGHDDAECADQAVKHAISASLAAVVRHRCLPVRANRDNAGRRQSFRPHRLMDIRQRTVSSICVSRPRRGLQSSSRCALSMHPTRRGELPGRRAP